MSISAALRLAAASGVALSAMSAAHAAVNGFAATKAQLTQNTTGGTIENLTTTYDNVTKRLTWDVSFSGPNNTAGPLQTKGFWLVVDNGPNPKGVTGELAILYFDATKVFAGTATKPTLTVYEYNGRNDNSSWNNGDGDGTANEGNDFKGLIYGANQASSFINSIVAEDVGGKRHFSFDINAAGIVGLDPAYDTAGTAWKGTGFEDKVGIWFHPVTKFDALYDTGSGKAGKITSLKIGGEGYLDTENNKTYKIPAPGSAALLGLGGLLAARRRRMA